MEMLLMGLCISVFGFGIAALAFGAATREEAAEPTAKAEVPAKPVVPGRFFVTPMLPVVPPARQVPIEVLLLQIENHVRLEQAAAESFVEFPTEALLHCKTTSPFVN